jgi:hypothetical protein
MQPEIIIHNNSETFVFAGISHQFGLMFNPLQVYIEGSFVTLKKAEHNNKVLIVLLHK